jgi:hypothetical protein
MNIKQECDEIMANMVQMTLGYLTDGGDEKAMKEIWIGIGIELDEWNKNTLDILNQ